MSGNKFGSAALAAAHETASDLHRAGGINKRTMRKFDALCLRTTGMARMHGPASPGELLREFMGERTVSELAEHIGVARATPVADSEWAERGDGGHEHPAGRGSEAFS